MSNGTGPTGDVVEGMHFTHCVSKDDYSNPVSFGVDAGLATLGKDEVQRWAKASEPGGS